jgi:uncharacterized protein (UPF0264 family)
MQLLVSVRSAAEVGAALSGGADIIDAKEPELGSLGPVPLDVLSAILDQVPPVHEISVALGDFSRPDDVQAAIQSLPLAGRECATYLKLGFAGVPGEELIVTLLESAVAASRSHLAQPRIVAVAYADAEQAGTAVPKVISRAAAQTGAAGVLLDTHGKVRGNLLSWLEPAALVALIECNRNNGLLAAVAGGLRAKDLGPIAAAGPDIVGFRGAACTGGRLGSVSKSRVRQLRKALQEGFGIHSGPCALPLKERVAKRPKPARISVRTTS